MNIQSLKGWTHHQTLIISETGFQQKVRFRRYCPAFDCFSLAYRPHLHKCQDSGPTTISDSISDILVPIVSLSLYCLLDPARLFIQKRSSSSPTERSPSPCEYHPFSISSEVLRSTTCPLHITFSSTIASIWIQIVGLVINHDMASWCYFWTEMVIFAEVWLEECSVLVWVSILIELNRIHDSHSPSHCLDWLFFGQDRPSNENEIESITDVHIFTYMREHIIDRIEFKWRHFTKYQTRNTAKQHGWWKYEF
jgi:hypothetical protein